MLIIEAIASYLNLAKMIDEGGYMEPQIFNVDKTALYWRNKPYRTFTARDELLVPDFRESRGRQPLSLGI